MQWRSDSTLCLHTNWLKMKCSGVLISFRICTNASLKWIQWRSDLILHLHIALIKNEIQCSGFTLKWRKCWSKFPSGVTPISSWIFSHFCFDRNENQWRFWFPFTFAKVLIKITVVGYSDFILNFQSLF